MKHYWRISTEHPDMCEYCHAVRAPRPEVDKEECPGEPPIQTKEEKDN